MAKKTKAETEDGFKENLEDLGTSDSKFAQDFDAPDHSGPEAHDEAVRTGVNPRTVATSSNPEGVAREGAIADEAAPIEPVSKSSPEDRPNEVNK